MSDKIGVLMYNTYSRNLFDEVIRAKIYKISYNIRSLYKECERLNQKARTREYYVRSKEIE